MIPLQQVSSPDQRNSLRNAMYAARHNADGGTAMFGALNYVVDSLESHRYTDGDTWIVCLTDGESADSNHVLAPKLQASPNNLHISLVGVNLHHRMYQNMTALCSKYQVDNQHNKGFFIPTTANVTAIQEAFGQVAARIPVSQTFELDGKMSDEECRQKLEEHRPDFIHRSNKLLYAFWVRYLYRRCKVFDENEEFNYNEDQDGLGSSLMEVMLSESYQNLRRDNTWASTNHTQLIYDFSMRDTPQFRLICTSPDDLPADQKKRLGELKLPGFFIPASSDLHKRETLDLYLSQALGIPLVEDQNGNKRLKCIDDNYFVLTLDFTLKLLNVNERVACGVPCIMEGETGVSKTALTSMYSILVNSQHRSAASASTQKDLEMILDNLHARYPHVSLNKNHEAAEKIRMYLEPSTQHDAVEASEIVSQLLNEAHAERSALFASIPRNVDTTRELLEWFAHSHLEPTFFEINIHGSMTADELKQTVDAAKRVAKKLHQMGIKVVIFLDEINTSSTLGLLKEMIVDQSFQGTRLETNIVVIAACNPVRNSVSNTKSSREVDLGRAWASGHYQVLPLPKSLATMTWDYGSLTSGQEKEFIYQRMVMMDDRISPVMARGMTEVISQSHELIRTLAKEHLKESLSSCPDAEDDAAQRARR